jgi:hypothetical protein
MVFVHITYDGERILIEGYRISSIQEEMDFSVIYEFISSSYWANGIPANTLKKAIKNLSASLFLIL